jgi:hypothetical protein
MQLLRKISRATVIGDNTSVMEKCLANKETIHPLYKVYGFATGTRKDTDIERKEDDKRPGFGSWECLIGQFEAVNLDTGEVFRSGQCFLPQFAIDMVSGQFGDGVERVKFAFEVGAKFDATTPTKYTYQVAPLLDVAEDDPLKAIAAMVEKPAQLTAPKPKDDKKK